MQHKNEPINQKAFKMIAVGDYLKGKKRHFIKNYAQTQGFNYNNLIPDTYEHFSFGTTIKYRHVTLQLDCTTGIEMCDSVRLQSYKNTNLFFIIFDKNKPRFSHVKEKWLPELQQFNKEIPIILVGLSKPNSKSTLNNQKIQEFIKEKQLTYFDCDLNNPQDLKLIFNKSLAKLFNEKALEEHLFKIIAVGQGFKQPKSLLSTLPKEILLYICDLIADALDEDKKQVHAFHQRIIDNTLTKNIKNLIWHVGPVAAPKKEEPKNEIKSTTESKNNKCLLM